MSKDDVFNITLADLKETADEFGRVVVEVPAQGMIIVMDDTIWGEGWIKQFPDTPHGLVLACRWAVRLEEDDETSDLSFEELVARYRAELEAPILELEKKRVYKITTSVTMSRQEWARLQALGCE